ncbi:hypothetical protein, partial [Nocardiopsis sp. MG754419]|uniref:hypothetical protein n=1 Tax=Nocardiopsis sp. MG754419 TaxID=2259865 RepID=UPI001BABAB96
VRAVLDDLAGQARSWLSAQGDHEIGPVRMEASADLSYLGQAHELRVGLGEGDPAVLDTASLAEASIRTGPISWSPWAESQERA